MGARLGLLVILALGPYVPTSAQGLFAGDKITHSIVGEEFTNSTLTIGMSVTEMLALTDRLLSPDPSVRADAMRRIEAMLPQKARLQAGAVAVLLDALGEQDLPAERLPDYFAEVAESFLKAQEEIAAFRVDDPEVAALRDSAATALGAPVPDQDAADRDLREATALVRAKREATERRLVEQERAEATLFRQRALVAASRLHRLHATDLYLEAAAVLPPGDLVERAANIRSAAGLLVAHGDERGDNATLDRAIALHREALALLDPKLRLRNGRSLSTISAWHSGPSVSAKPTLPSSSRQLRRTASHSRSALAPGSRLIGRFRRAIWASSS